MVGVHGGLTRWVTWWVDMVCGHGGLDMVGGQGGWTWWTWWVDMVVSMVGGHGGLTWSVDMVGLHGGWTWWVYMVGGHGGWTWWVGISDVHDTLSCRFCVFRLHIRVLDSLTRPGH